MKSLEHFFEIFFAFFRASNLAFGGGPAIIPLVQAEVVNHGWMTIEQFSEGLAIVTSLPGPIATLLSGFVGYHVGGWLGVLAALLGTLALTSILVIVLTDFLMKNSESPVLKGALTGVRPLVTVLVAKTAFDMGLSAFPNFWSWVIAGLAMICLYKFKLHPGIVIILSMVFGVIVLG
ncbi:chromate transporter [Desulfitobacterium dichloroeliminans]|uniref:chromate transporter n=1 Tax=Desulfitobacterium dichloroeliminans TaxID=233055 RepID=UPI00059CB0A0|nr:chromate transporter [Desulfitobacterium dichloroeliminans]